MISVQAFRRQFGRGQEWYNCRARSIHTVKTRRCYAEPPLSTQNVSISFRDQERTVTRNSAQLDLSAK